MVDSLFLEVAVMLWLIVRLSLVVAGIAFLSLAAVVGIVVTVRGLINFIWNL